MKYSNNHPYKFYKGRWYIPFGAGLLQVLMVVSIETVNLINICAQVSITDIVSNYVALAIVADFDDFVCKAITRNDPIKELFGK